MSVKTADTNGHPESLSLKPAPGAKATTGKRKARRVYGRRLVEVEGRKFWFEMRRNGLHVRRYKHRKEQGLSFARLIDMFNDQLHLNF